MFQQTVQRFNLIRPVCNTQVVEGLQRPTITPGAELIHVIPTCPVSVFRQRDYLKRSVYSASLVSFLKGHKSFQSTQSTLYSSIPSFPMPSIMSILYQIKKKTRKKIYWTIQILTSPYSWLSLSEKTPWIQFLSLTNKETTWMYQVPAHSKRLWAGHESLKWDSKMCLPEYCHRKPLKWELLIQKLLLEEPKETAGFWLQTEKSANSFEIQMPTLRHIWKQTQALLI